MKFNELDVVRIIRLNKPVREIDGTPDIMRQPQIGDNGAIVNIMKSNQGTIYTVENVDSEGFTIWLADFTQEEIETY